MVDDVGAVLDLDEFLMVGAVQAMVGDWDGFFGARNNYKIYHNPDSDRFELLPWGVDATMIYPSYDLDHSESDRTRAYFFLRCLASSGCQAQYYQQVAEVVAIWEFLDLGSAMDSDWQRIAELVEYDPTRPWNSADMAAARADLAAFLEGRATTVSKDLADMGW